MKLIDIIKLSTRMFRTRPGRTWLTILGIGVGIGAVVVLVSLGYGLQGILLERIIFGESLLSLNVSNPPSKAVVLGQQEVENLIAIENVGDVSPLAGYSSLVTFKDLTGSISLYAVNPSYFRYAGIPAFEGEFFNKDEPDKVILSTAVLKMFELEPSQIIGQTVQFRVSVQQGDTDQVQEISLDKHYEVNGIIDNSSSLFAYMNLSEFSSHFSPPYYERVQVKVESSEFLDSVESKIIEAGFVVTAFSKTVEQANKIFQGIQATLGLFGGIALVVSAIGMFNTMTVTLLERTNEIGVMRTIGASSKDIMILFLAESVLLGFLGGVVGVGVGFGIGKSLNLLVNTAATRLGGVAMTLFIFPTTFLMFIIIFAGVMGFITGIFPARKASSLNPLDAIRYK
jgi:putative ABC transport system permease protein